MLRSISLQFTRLKDTEELGASQRSVVGEARAPSSEEATA